MQSSPPLSSSQQSSLYQYYTPIASNESSTTTRALQPSTQQNIPHHRSRITIKRPLHPKDTASPVSPAKKLKSSVSVEAPLEPIENVPLRRHARETFPRSLLHRGLNGQRGELSQCIHFAYLNADGSDLFT
jgi:hypothetical protein